MGDLKKKAGVGRENKMQRRWRKLDVPQREISRKIIPGNKEGWDSGLKRNVKNTLREISGKEHNPKRVGALNDRNVLCIHSASAEGKARRKKTDLGHLHENTGFSMQVKTAISWLNIVYCVLDIIPILRVLL